MSTQVSSSESENFGNNPPQQTDSLAFQLDNILKEEEEEIIFERTFPDSKIQKNASKSKQTQQFSSPKRIKKANIQVQPCQERRAFVLEKQQENINTTTLNTISVNYPVLNESFTTTIKSKDCQEAFDPTTLNTFSTGYPVLHKSSTTTPQTFSADKVSNKSPSKRRQKKNKWYQKRKSKKNINIEKSNNSNWSLSLSHSSNMYLRPTRAEETFISTESISSHQNPSLSHSSNAKLRPTLKAHSRSTKTNETFMTTEIKSQLASMQTPLQLMKDEVSTIQRELKTFDHGKALIKKKLKEGK